MADMAAHSATASSPNFNIKPSLSGIWIFLVVLVAGLTYSAHSIISDVNETHVPVTSWLPFILLGIALLVALGFEFVNGFHDTANAVATVIYTHSLPPHFAVVWSGLWNFFGVLVSSGAVAFGILALLPVELILQVGSSAGFAMVFALLIAAILWNVGTWYLGLPASSSHTLIGSIIGVGLANQLMHGASGTSGVDLAQVTKVGWSLLLSPLIGFFAAALLLLVLKMVAKNPQLYREPKGRAAPPWWIRGILILTCTGVSFAHGSNDGQKGMGLIMLILIGTVPTAYALNRAMPDVQVTQFLALTHVTQETLQHDATHDVTVAPQEVRPQLMAYIRTHKSTGATIPALAQLLAEIGREITADGGFKSVPIQSVQNVRNDMYIASETIRYLGKDHGVTLTYETNKNLVAMKKSLDAATKFIPLWVKVAVAIALGLGTMIGWKRIVVTVGERIGKTHLTYAQGASAELVAMSTIAAADAFGLPVSTTHVLSSGVAGTMAANRSGLQIATVRNLLMAWVLTLPTAIFLSGTLYFIFVHLF